MSTNGKTATDFSENAGAAGAGAGAGTGAVGTEVGAALRLDSQGRSTAIPAMAKPIRDAMTMAVRFFCGAFVDGAAVCAVGVEAGVTTGVCIASRAAETSFGMAHPVSPLLASNQCDVFRKYSKSAGNGA